MEHDTGLGAGGPLRSGSGIVVRILSAMAGVALVSGGAALAAGSWGLSFGAETLTVELGGCERGYRGAPNSCRIEWEGQPEEGRLSSVVVGSTWPEHETVRVRTSPGKTEAVLDHGTVRANLIALPSLLAGAGTGLVAYAARGWFRLWMLAPGAAGTAAYLTTMAASGLT